MKTKRANIIFAFIMFIVILVVARGIYMEGKKTEVITLTGSDLKGFYKNPSGVNGIGDPFVLKASDGKYYMYATSAPDGYLVWSSEDLINWKQEGYALRKGNDGWMSSDFWAPEVVEYNGKYYMYYTARWKERDSLRIGVAVSDNPIGPFADAHNSPMFDFGYAAIDANILVDDNGKKYLYFSRDCSENIIDGRHESHIYGVELNDDMVSIKGEPTLLTKPEQEWEKESGPVWFWNEGPAVIKRDGTYYLIYSANFYKDKSYGLGYATSENPLGPYVKYADNPILSYVSYEKVDQNGRKVIVPSVSGPGHNSITVSPDGSEYFVVYHTHTNPRMGSGNRQVCVDRMGFRKDGSIYINGPTLSEQPLPSGIGEFINVALKAKASASSVKEGYTADAINDGQIGIQAWSSKYDWVSKDEDKGAWVKLEWDRVQKIHSILIYGSPKPDRVIISGRLVFDNGKYIDNITIPSNTGERPGQAAIVNFPEMEVKWVKFIVSESQKNSQEVGLSEIYVMGKDISKK